MNYANWVKKRYESPSDVLETVISTSSVEDFFKKIRIERGRKLRPRRKKVLPRKNTITLEYNGKKVCEERFQYLKVLEIFPGYDQAIGNKIAKQLQGSKYFTTVRINFKGRADAINLLLQKSTGIESCFIFSNSLAFQCLRNAVNLKEISLSSLTVSERYNMANFYKLSSVVFLAMKDLNYENSYGKYKIHKGLQYLPNLETFHFTTTKQLSGSGSNQVIFNAQINGKSAFEVHPFLLLLFPFMALATYTMFGRGAFLKNRYEVSYWLKLMKEIKCIDNLTFNASLPFLKFRLAHYVPKYVEKNVNIS